MKNDDDVIQVNFCDTLISFNRNELDAIKKNIKEQNRINFLFSHLEIYEKFIDHKLNDGIGIIELTDDSEFITCDNPVIIRNSSSILRNIFDSRNMIILPIDNKHLLQILPQNEQTLQQTFTRVKGDFSVAIANNYDIEKHSEKWIIGSKTSLESYLETKVSYQSETPENLIFLENLDRKLKLHNEFLHLMEQTKENFTNELIVSMLKICLDPIFKDDSNMKYNLEMLLSKISIK